MGCLDSIVSLGLCPDETVSTSGFKLIDAPGISIKGLASIANETYMSGANLAMEKKRLTLIQIQNDFIGALQSNNIVTTITNTIYDTSIINPNLSMGNYAGERGIVLHKTDSYRGTLRKTSINTIQVYPLQSGDATIKIYISTPNKQVFEYSYAVTLVANQLNTFDKTQLSGFPFELPQYTHSAKVLIDNTDIAFASAEIMCGKGCDGSVPNPCGWADGWDGTRPEKGQGYGINLSFECECDYTKILCDLSKSFSGELIWLKWAYNIFYEQYQTNRFNGWVIYNRDEIFSRILPDLENKYNAKWNDLMNGMVGILKNYHDDCLSCKGLRWVTNV